MPSLRCLLVPAVLLSCAAASEYHGAVVFKGLPVPGATVTATQGDRKLIVTTDESGAYSFRDLPDGIWRIDVEMAGFTKSTKEVAVVPAAPAPKFELALAPMPPAPAPTVRVDGGPGRGAPPSAPALAAQQAAARAAQAQAAARGGGGGGMGGGMGDAFVMSGSLGASGGSMMQADSFGNSIRNGQVQYNGNAAFSLDNSVWDAQSYSLNGIQTPKPAFAKGRVNLSFGGPLRIPKVLKSKGGMFTLNYQMGRTRNGVTSSITVPTALERAGDFSQSVVQGPVTVYDPLSGAPFPNNRIPGSRLDTAALALAAYYPLPNAPGSRLNYQAPIVSVSNQDNLNSRINQQFGKKDRIAGSIGYQHSDSRNPNIFGFIDNGSNSGINVSVSYTHTFSRKVIETISYNFSRSRTELSPFFANHENVAAELGIQGTSGLPLNFGPPNLSFTNFFGLSDGNASLSRNQTSSVSESLLINFPKHQFNIGGSYRRQQINPLSDPNGRGSFAFTGLNSSLNGVGGYDFADFLLSMPDTASIRYGNADKYFRTWHADTYFTDNWQISKAFTATLGLRYDYTAPYTEIYGRMANLDVAPGFADVSVVRAGQAGKFSGSLPSSIMKPDYTQFAPNFGLAWRLFPNKKKMPTMMRFGYGYAWPVDVLGNIANNLAGQPPFARVLTVGSSPSNPLTLQTGFLTNPVVANTYAIDPNYRPISLQQWMVLLIQPLPSGLYVVGGFVGIRAEHLTQELLPNSVPPGSAALSPFPTAYIYDQSNGMLSGNLGVVQIMRQMGSGFTASFSDTFSRISDNGGVLGMYSSMAQDWTDLSVERARSALIPRQQINFNWQYSSGQGKAGGTLVKGWKGALLKDWTVTNGLSWRSGPLLTATVGGNLATIPGTGITGIVRADATGQAVGGGSGQPFNLAAFAPPAAGHWGNAGRNTISGPAQWGLNGSIGRIFRINERRSVDLRFDANNFLNHMTLTGWGTVVNSFNYGLPTGTNAMRSMNATLRFRF